MNCVVVLIATGTQLAMHVAAVLRPARVFVMAGKHMSKPKEPIKVACHQWAVGNTRSIPNFWGPAQEAWHKQIIDTIRGKTRNNIQQKWKGGRKHIRLVAVTSGA